MRSRAGTALLAVALGVATLGGASSGSTNRSLAVRGLTLSSEDPLVIALHPTATPIEIETSGSGLEACQATLDGGVGRSWPSFAGFDECIPFDDEGRATLPSVGVDTFHLAFLVRGIEEAPVDVGRLTISYEPGDGFFTAFPPPIRPGGKSPRLLVRPSTSDAIYVSVTSPKGHRPLPASTARLVIEQRGEPLAALAEDELASQAGPAYGPAELGRLVTVRGVNLTGKALHIGISVDWS